MIREIGGWVGTQQQSQTAGWDIGYPYYIACALSSEPMHDATYSVVLPPAFDRDLPYQIVRAEIRKWKYGTPIVVIKVSA